MTITNPTRTTHRPPRQLGAAALAASLLLGSGWALAQTPGAAPQDLYPGSQGDPAAEATETLPQEVWVLTQVQVVAPQEQALYELHDPSQPMSRAEVIADLNIWRRAGLGGPVSDNPGAQAELEDRMQVYQQMRNSPAFLAEVEQVLAQQDEAGAGAAEDGAPR